MDLPHLFPSLLSDRWSLLILFFQPASTTANMVTVLAQLLHQPAGAQLVAMSNVPQMLLYAPVATFYVATGMAWTN